MTGADRVQPSTDSRSNIIIELSTQISDQEYRIATLETQLQEKDLLITNLQSGKLSPRDAHALISMEAEKTSQEMQALAKELKVLKRKKQKNKSERKKAVDGNEGDYSREISALSRDSGATDLSFLRRSDTNDLDTAEPYTLYTPNHSEFSSTSTLVT